MQVYNLDRSPWAPAFVSKYCRGAFVWDLEKASPKESLEYLADIGRKLGGRCALLAITDLCALFIADHAEFLQEWFLFPRRKAGLVRALYDKKCMHQLACERGVPTPETVFPETQEDLAQFLDAATFPVVFKASDGIHIARRGLPTKAIVWTREELVRIFARIKDSDLPYIMLQEYIPGVPDSVWMFEGYFDNQSRCQFGLTGRKLRQYPPYTGASSLAICEPNGNIDTTMREFMQAIGYCGGVDAGFRYDPRTDSYKILDINCRTGSSFRLFTTDNGMDVVRALYCDVTGQSIVAGQPRWGRKWIVEDLDAASSLRYFLDRNLTLRNWLRSLRGIQESAVFCRDDWKAGLAVFRSDLMHVFRRMAAGKRRERTNDAASRAIKAQRPPQPTGRRPDPAVKESALRNALAVLLSGITLTFYAATLQAVAPVQAWVLSSLERATPTGAPGNRRSIHLFAARGEWEAFQVVLRTPRHVQLEIAPSDLVRADGRAIGREDFSLYAAHFVRVDKPSPDRHGSNRSMGSGLYPDVLIPAPASVKGNSQMGGKSNVLSLALRGGENQAVWIDIFVPREAAPGKYEGVIFAKSTAGAATVPVTLTVWDFHLPLRPSLKSSFGFKHPSRALFEELLRHKMMPQRIVESSCTSDCPAARTTEEDLLRTMGLAATDAGFWSGADHNTCAMRTAPSAKAFINAAKSHAPELFLFNYTADEIDSCPGLLRPMKEWARNMRGSGIKNLMVMAPVPELLEDRSGEGSLVDIWVVLPKMYDTALRNIRQALQRGNEVWSYNTLAQDAYSPKWLVDYEPINFRLQPGF